MHDPLADVDLRALGEWMREQGLTDGAITDAVMLTGGTQNVLIRFTSGGRDLVLRRGPWHLRPRSNETIRREARVLHALRNSNVPHPRLVAAGPDDDIIGGGAAFLLMDAVDGFNPTISLPPLHQRDAHVRHEMGLAAVDGIIALGAVDAQAVGLGDFGKVDGYLERQVLRWRDELDSYARHEGYPGPSIPGLEMVSNWLRENQPTSFVPGLTHGDYHLANLLYAPDGPRVAAIVDWEMCTLGDPLLDIGWLLATWPTPDDPGVAGAVGMAGGLPTTEELVRRYADASPRDCSFLTWYEVLACFKLGIILEGTHARACAGKAPVEVGELLHAMTLTLFQRATTRITKG